MTFLFYIFQLITIMRHVVVIQYINVNCCDKSTVKSRKFGRWRHQPGVPKTTPSISNMRQFSAPLRLKVQENRNNVNTQQNS